MGLSSTTNRATFAGDGSSTVFSFPYEFFSTADLLVYLFDTTAGASTLQTLNTNYTISGGVNLQGIYPGGGNVVMASSVPVGLQIVVTRAPSPVQNYQLLQNGQINSAALVQQFDYMTSLIQRLTDRVSRSVQLPDGQGILNSTPFNTTLPQITPLPASAGGAPLIVNSGATGFTYGVVASNGSSSASYFGVLPVINGGTGQSVPLSANGLIYAASPTAMGVLSPGGPTQVLVGGGSSAPAFQTFSTAIIGSGILSVANGGTNSGLPLNNGFVVQSLGGSLVESPIAVSQAALNLGQGMSLSITGSTGSVILQAGSSVTGYRMVLPPSQASGFISNDGNGNLSFASAAGSALSLSTKSANYNATTSDDIVIAGSGTAIVRTYGPTGSSGKVLRIKNSSLGVVTIVGSAATIDGTSVVLSQQYAGAELMCDGANFFINKFIPRSPTLTILTSSGIYTTPFGVTQLRVRQTGGGGGSAGSGTANSSSTGGSGGPTILGSSVVVTNAGTGGTWGAGSGGPGGTAFLGSSIIGFAQSGGQGGGGIGGTAATSGSSGPGGQNPFAGGGNSGSGAGSGTAGIAKTGGGGGGPGSAANLNTIGGDAGGAGGYAEALINTPLATYTYVVGEGGSAGNAGTNGSVGKAGGSGTILIEERYS